MTVLSNWWLLRKTKKIDWLAWRLVTLMCLARSATPWNFTLVRFTESPIFYMSTHRTKTTQVFIMILMLKTAINIITKVMISPVPMLTSFQIETFWTVKIVSSRSDLLWHANSAALTKWSNRLFSGASFVTLTYANCAPTRRVDFSLQRSRSNLINAHSCLFRVLSQA